MRDKINEENLVNHLLLERIEENDCLIDEEEYEIIKRYIELFKKIYMLGIMDGHDSYQKNTKN